MAKKTKNFEGFESGRRSQLGQLTLPPSDSRMGDKETFVEWFAVSVNCLARETFMKFFQLLSRNLKSLEINISSFINVFYLLLYLLHIKNPHVSNFQQKSTL